MLNISISHITTFRSDHSEFCAFSPNSKTILSGCWEDNSIKLWDLEGRCLKTLKGHTSSVRAGAFHPNNCSIILSVSDDKTLRLWNRETERQLLNINASLYSLTDCAFSPDGKIILYASEDTMLGLYSTEGRWIRMLDGHSSSVNACAFSPNGNVILSASADKTLRAWDKSTGKYLQMFQGHSSSVDACAFSPDGRTILSASADNTLRLWNLDGNCTRILKGHTAPVIACAFSPNGKTILSASQDNTLRLWSLDGVCLKIQTTAHYCLTDCIFSPNGEFILSVGNGDIALWKVATVALSPLSPTAMRTAPEVTYRREITPSHYESAYYACQSYLPGCGETLSGWEILDSCYPEENQWNFGMACYFHTERKELIVAFRGTENPWDLLADFALWRGQTHPNQELAIRHIATRTSQLLPPDVQRSISDASDSLARIYLETNRLRQILLPIAVPMVSLIYESGKAFSLNPKFRNLASDLTQRGIIGDGVDYKALQASLLSNMNKEVRSAPSGLITQFSNAIAKANLKSITFVGHSMGGYLAEMVACFFNAEKLKHPDCLNCEITALTLDSPGCKAIIEGLPDYRCSNYNFITTYLSAPNLVNTCHQHLGNIRRLYIPHVERFSGAWWAHTAWSIVPTIAGIGTYFATADHPPLAAAASTATSATRSAKADRKWDALATASATTASLTAFGLVFRDSAWLLRQHSSSNQLACFKGQPEPPVYSVMEAWPYINDLSQIIKNKISGLMRSLIPLQKDVPGIRTMFYPDWMYENQIKGIPEYKIARNGNVGILPDWI